MSGLPRQSLQSAHRCRVKRKVEGKIDLWGYERISTTGETVGGKQTGGAIEAIRKIRAGRASTLAAGPGVCQFTSDRARLFGRCLQVFQHPGNVLAHLPQKLAFLVDVPQFVFG